MLGFLNTTDNLRLQRLPTAPQGEAARPAARAGEAPVGSVPEAQWAHLMPWPSGSHPRGARESREDLPPAPSQRRNCSVSSVVTSQLACYFDANSIYFG